MLTSLKGILMDSKYCYPNSNVLKNKLNIKNGEELLKAETELASVRLLGLQLKPVKGNFDFDHLCRIHKRIFQDLYTWAGRPRTVDISKNNLFCLVQNLPSYAASVFEHYYRDCFLSKDDKQKFVHKFTEHYADLNALHPYREGNGRSQREFARELCLACGYAFDLTHTSHQEMVKASIASFRGDNEDLERIFEQAVQPLSE